MQVDTTLLRMNNTNIPKLVYEYIQTVRRNIGQPRERWSGEHLRGWNKPGTAHTLLLLMT
jgi:hypothetical protein